MYSLFTSARRRTLCGLIYTSTFICFSASAEADQLESYLHSAYEVESANVPIAQPYLGESYPQGMLINESLSEPTEAETDTEDADESEDDGSDITKLSEKIEAFGEDLDGFEKSLEKVEKLAGNKSIVVSNTSKATMKISGRIHVDGWGFDTNEDPAINQFNGGSDPDNRLGFRRLRLAASGKIKDNMKYKLELEMAGANKSEFRDAYIGWSNLPIFQEVLLGNQKRPFGLDHLNSSRYNVFIERPFVIEAFNEDARRLGLQSYGITDDLAWNWRYGVFNQRNIQDEGNYTGDHLQLQVAGRLANTIWYDETSNGRGYAHWAISGSHADVSTDAVSESRFRTRPEARTESTRWLDTGQIAGADYYNLIGLEGVVNLGALQIVGEYQSNWVERDGAEDVRLDGGYIYASYFLTGEHMPWERKSGTIGRVVPFQNFWMVDSANCGRAAGWGAWQLAARYSKADFSDEDIFGGEGEALTIGMNWHWNTNARMQFNYITGDISNSTVGNRMGAPVSGEYDVYGARFLVDF
ncbi:Porin P precursor [Planctomycetes bacterium CA13]|uniref:Porin P n=1 Tax=Novipirellula herctigrandis TaxID=2527986 RepID=A0A5C5YYP8_9BACT|nr:Porin P precursor [Planctomycetes bacterium CA13]